MFFTVKNRWVVIDDGSVVFSSTDETSAKAFIVNRGSGVLSVVLSIYCTQLAQKKKGNRKTA